MREKRRNETRIDINSKIIRTSETLTCTSQPIVVVKCFEVLNDHCLVSFLEWIDIGQDLEPSFFLHGLCLWSFRTKCRRFIIIGLIVVLVIYYHQSGFWILPFSWKNAHYTGTESCILNWVIWSWQGANLGSFVPRSNIILKIWTILSIKMFSITLIVLIFDLIRVPSRLSVSSCVQLLKWLNDSLGICLSRVAIFKF